MVVTEIERKLSPRMREKWIEMVTGDKKEEFNSAQFPLLLKFLKQCKARFEYDIEDIRNESEEKEELKTHGVPHFKEMGEGNDTNQRRMVKCFYCEKVGHSAYQCHTMR